MSFEAKRAAVVRYLAQGPTGDYATFTAAMADVASWTTLIVCPGTYTFDTATLPAGKTIEGVDRDRCIIQTTHNNLADDIVLACGNGSTLRNFYLRGAAAGNVRIHLIDFSTATAGQYVVLDNMRFDNGGGVQPYSLDAPVRATNSWFDVFNDELLGAIGYGNIESVLMGCYIRKYSNVASYPFSSASGILTLTSCVVERLGADGRLINAYATVRISACKFTNIEWLHNGNSNSVSISGSDLGGSKLSVAATTYYLQGNINYGTPNGAATGIFKAVDPGLTVSVTSTPVTIYGWANFVYVNNAAATAITMPACANFGAPYLLIADTSGDADRYPITLTRASTDVFAGYGTFGTSTTFVIQEKYGWVVLMKNEDPAADQWRMVACSRMQWGDMYGQLETNGFCQRAWLEATGDITLFGDGMFDPALTDPVGVYGINAVGGYLQQQTTGAAGDRAYAASNNPNGPLTGVANWDLVFRFELTAASNDIRFAAGAWDWSGRALTDALDSNDPNGPHVLIQKISGAATARLSVRDNTIVAGGVQTVTNFPTWTPAANTVYFLILRKRSTTFTAYVFSTAGALLDFAIVTPVTLLATCDMAVLCGMRDTVGAAGRHINQYGWYGAQVPAGLAFL